MSAAPRPDPDSGSEPADSGWALLDGLRRRLDDQAALTRKTAGQVHQLAESIGALVAEQRRRARWLNINSFVAYLIFTVLCGGAFYFLYQSRARELIAERDRTAADRDRAVRKADDLAAAAKAREDADARALDAWQLLEAGKREAAAKQLAGLSGAPLSPLDRTVLAAHAKQAELVEVDAALKSAATAMRASRFADAAATLDAALTLQGAGPRLPDVHYQLAMAQIKLGTVDKALVHLQAAVAGDVGEEDARFQLAGALDRLGWWGKARVEYDRFATAHPQSGYAVAALRRSAVLAHMPDVAPWVGKPGAPAAVASIAPAPKPAVAPVPAAPAIVPAPSAAPHAPEPTAPGSAPAVAPPAVTPPAAPVAPPATPVAPAAGSTQLTP